MKTSLTVLSAVLSLASTLAAQPAPRPAQAGALKPPAAQQPPRVMDPAARSNMLAKTGGIVQQPASGPSLLVLNTQTRVASAAFEDATTKILKVLRLPTALRSRPSAEPVTEALKALADTNTAAVVVIADLAGYPALLIAPESRWALVNVAALGGSDTPPEKRTERAQKELWRAFGYLMGAANSNFESCLLKSVLTTEDLDALKPMNLCPEPFNKIMAHAQKLGMKPTRMSTYRKAVEEGWAHAPTNDFQRAIWSELKK
ncbi:MAG: hypothetical protein WCK89_08150 [bacterium]